MFMAIFFSMAMIIVMVNHFKDECFNDGFPEQVYYDYHGTTKTPPMTPYSTPDGSLTPDRTKLRNNRIVRTNHWVHILPES